MKSVHLPCPASNTCERAALGSGTVSLSISMQAARLSRRRIPSTHPIRSIGSNCDLGHRCRLTYHRPLVYRSKLSINISFRGRFGTCKSICMKEAKEILRSSRNFNSRLKLDKLVSTLSKSFKTFLTRAT